jgi:hypothetical protein
LQLLAPPNFAIFFFQFQLKPFHEPVPRPCRRSRTQSNYFLDDFCAFSITFDQNDVDSGTAHHQLIRPSRKLRNPAQAHEVPMKTPPIQTCGAPDASLCPTRMWTNKEGIGNNTKISARCSPWCMN